MSTVAEPIVAVRPSASPRLAFRDPAKAIEFYQRALGAEEKFRFQIGDNIPHAELMIGDSAIDITGEWPEGGRSRLFAAGAAGRLSSGGPRRTDTDRRPGVGRRA